MAGAIIGLYLHERFAHLVQREGVHSLRAHCGLTLDHKRQVINRTVIYRTPLNPNLPDTI